ncbi:MAG: nuclear transport factor 2 family protein [Pseudomonadales bacterium]|jgi:hypothetical protein|nr:nuclear transport factor 2 family protein [Pseudomonadales bacterium]
MNAELLDKLTIRQLVDDWIIYSDGGFDWERFRAVWHDDGRMMATWTQGNADEFVAMRKMSFEKGATSILHFHGAHTSDVSGDRATAQTKMMIMQRAPVEGVMCDVTCNGRFFDFFERRKGKWGFVHRQPIYEKDWITPCDPHNPPRLDPALLQSFPEGYRHLAYLQTRLGFNVKKDMPGLKGPQVEGLYAAGRQWLAGATDHPIVLCGRVGISH